jgi:hypothetical protein
VESHRVLIEFDIKTERLLDAILWTLPDPNYQTILATGIKGG